MSRGYLVYVLIIAGLMSAANGRGWSLFAATPLVERGTASSRGVGGIHHSTFHK